MPLDHVVVSLPATTKTAIYTLPKGATACHVTIQNRDTVASMSIGDDTLGGVSGANAGISLPLAASANAPTTIQLWLNGGDTIYGYASAAMTNSCVILTSYVNTAGS